jgi:hypothetical protein
VNQVVIQPAFPGLVEFDSRGVPHQRIAPLAERRILTECEEIPLEKFELFFKHKAGDHWQQVERLFKEYGPFLSVPCGMSMIHAEEAGELDWCLNLLEEHLREDLSYQHPDLRGRLILGSNTQNRSTHFLEQSIIRVLRPDFFK